MREQYSTIAQVAEALNIAERTAWRRLKTGRIQKHKSEDGNVFFVLPELTDTDMSDNSTVTCQASLPDSRSISHDKAKSPIIDSLREELTATELQFRIEKAEAARREWLKRKDKDCTEESEQKALLEAKKIQLERHDKEKAIAEDLKKQRVQKLKAIVVPLAVIDVFPSDIVSEIFLSIEKLCSNVDINIPFDELCVLAKAVRNNIIRTHAAEIKKSFALWGQGVIFEMVKSIEKDYEKFKH